MSGLRFLGWLLAMGILPLMLSAAELPGTGELESLVGRWVDLRAQADVERRDWANRSAQWRQEMELLEMEQTQLTQALATLEQAGESQQERSADLLTRREALTSTLSQVDTAMTGLQPRLIALLPAVPEPLLTDGMKATRLPDKETSDVSDGQTTARRIQQFLGVLKELEELHSSVHTVKALIALPAGPRREMDVLFLGLARGFAVTADGSAAAVGVPTAEGWRWSPAASLATDIRQLIQVASQEIPPALISFPIGGETGMTPVTKNGVVK